MHRPVVLLACLYALGVVLARHFDLTGGGLLLSAGAALIVAAIAYFAARKTGRWFILALFVLLGMAVTGLTVEQTATPLAAWEDRTVTLEGVVVRDADIRPDRVLYVLEVQKARLGDEIQRPGGRVLVSHHEPDVVYGYGDVLTLRGVLRAPQPPGNPGEFDYRAYLQRQGVSHLVTIRGAGALKKTGVDRSNPFVYRALTLKERLKAGLERALDPEPAAIVRGITMGVRGGIDPAVREAFTATGVVHILSVSGLHVGFLLALTLLLTRLARLKPAWTVILVTGILAFYAVMVGFKPSVIRASVMAVLLLTAHQLGRMRDWPTALAMAALVILLGNPLALFDPGFHLSFAATWGILYLGPPLVRGLGGLAGRARLPWKTSYSWVIAVPLAAQLGTLPLVACYYNLVSPVSLLTNLAGVPLVALIFGLGLATAVLGAFAPAAAWLTAPATAALVDVFLALVRFCAEIPGAFFYVATPSFLLVAAWYLVCYAVGFFAGQQPWRERLTALTAGWRGLSGPGRRAAGFAMGGLFLVAAFLAWPTGTPGPHGLEVHFLDVGQGDCTLIRTSTGSNILIDAGGRRGELDGEPGVGDRVVVPYLRRLGIKQIDLLVLTHPHEDHAGGARTLNAKLDVRRVLVAPLGGREAPPPGYADLLIEFERAGVAVDDVWAGDRVQVDDVTLRVLGPTFPLLAGTRSDLNSNSVVLRLDYGQRSFLFTGDIEQEAQARLLLRENIQADVLKVPHHGSGAFVPDFFRAVRPEVAVISVGPDNSFGHPHPDTLAALREIDVEIYRTDQHGAIIIRTDGNRLHLETGRPVPGT